MDPDPFEIIAPITRTETIAVGRSIREIAISASSSVVESGESARAARFANGIIARAEVHWYEAHGIGRRKMKIKQFWIIQ